MREWGEKMKRDKAIEKIDTLVNVLSVEIPQSLEINGEKYEVKKEILKCEDRERLINKYQQIYDDLREKILDMEDVPENIVNAALILRRIVLFLKEFRKSEDIEEKKRWLEYVRKLGM